MMLDVDSFTQAIEQTRSVLPGGPKNDDAVLSYYEELCAIDELVLRKAFKQARRELDYFPKIRWLLEFSRNNSRPERQSGFQLPPAREDQQGCPAYVREYMRQHMKKGRTLWAQLAALRSVSRSRLVAEGRTPKQYLIDACPDVRAAMREIDAWSRWDDDNKAKMRQTQEGMENPEEPVEISYTYTIEGDVA